MHGPMARSGHGPAPCLPQEGHGSARTEKERKPGVATELRGELRQRGGGHWRDEVDPDARVGGRLAFQLRGRLVLREARCS